MPFTYTPELADGPPELEGVFIINSPPDNPTVFLNDYMDPNTGNDKVLDGSTWFSYSRCSEITGLKDKPDADDPRVNLTNRIGERAFPRQQRGKTITFQGRVYADSLQRLRAWQSLVESCAAARSSDPLDWQMFSYYGSSVYNGDATPYDTAGYFWLAYAIPIGFTMSNKQDVGPDAAPTPYQRAFTLSMRMSDPRWWLNQIGGDDAAQTASGGDGDSAGLFLDGSAPSEPTFTITGTGGGSATILLEHIDLGRQLQIAMDSELDADELLVVDFFNRKVTRGGDDYTGYVDWPNTDWWGEAASGQPMIYGSTNTLQVSGDPWAVSAYQACW